MVMMMMMMMIASKHDELQCFRHNRYDSGSQCSTVVA